MRHQLERGTEKADSFFLVSRIDDQDLIGEHVNESGDDFIVVVDNRANEEIEVRRLENGGENANEGIQIGSGEERGTADGV